MGVPLCSNKNDLKVCKLNLPEMDPNWNIWNPIQTMTPHETCNSIIHPEYVLPFNQRIDKRLKSDGSQYNCFNRGDENPFHVTNGKINGSEVEKTWLQWINTPCDSVFIEDRRCLGSRPDHCVAFDSKNS
jgi:hypothetical protein